MWEPQEDVTDKGCEAGGGGEGGWGVGCHYRKFRFVTANPFLAFSFMFSNIPEAWKTGKNYFSIIVLYTGNLHCVGIELWQINW